VLDTMLFHLKRGFKEFCKDVEVEVTEIWENIKELFQKEEGL
jgi:hypothetical protein